MQFTDPTPPGDFLDLKEVNGALLILTPVRVEKDVQTVHGESDAVVTNVQVVDGPHAGETYDDTMIFPKLLRSQLSKQIGNTLVARLGQGAKQPGKNPPWMLTAATEAEKAKATQYLNSQLTTIPAGDDSPY